MNKVIIMGRLGREPEFRTIQNETQTLVATLSVATSKKVKGEEQTEWHRVVLFGKPAEIIQQYLKKGDQALFEGELRTRKWTDNQNIERYTTEIVADRFEFVGGNTNKQQQPQAGQAPQQGYQQPAQAPQQGYQQPQAAAAPHQGNYQAPQQGYQAPAPADGWDQDVPF